MLDAKILIFGNGYLGSRIAEYFGERAEISKADVTNLEEIRTVLGASNPSVVINTAAKTLTGQLEKPENQGLAYRVNVQGAANIAYACKELGIYLVHISTAMMFDGPGITETTIPAPTNYYSWTKAWADAQLVPLMDTVLITRIHTPLSNQAHPRNLLTKLQNFDKVVDEPSSLTVVEDFLSALEELIQKKATGIFNVVNPGSISLYEICDLLGKPVSRLTKQDIAEMSTASGSAQQTYPILNTDKLTALGIFMRPVKDAIETSIKEYHS